MRSDAGDMTTSPPTDSKAERQNPTRREAKDMAKRMSPTKPQAEHLDELHLKSRLADRAFAAFFLVLLLVVGLIVSGRPLEAGIVAALCGLAKVYFDFLAKLVNKKGPRRQ